MQIVHACRNGELYRVHIGGVTNIADLLRESHLDTLTSAHGLVFWLTPSTHAVHMAVNRQATALFLASTSFTARTVPLLRGNIVVSNRDDSGDLAGLTDAQVTRLTDSALPEVRNER